MDQAVNFFFVFDVDPYGFGSFRPVADQFLIERANTFLAHGIGLLLFDGFKNGPLDPSVEVVGLPWPAFPGGQVEAENAPEELALGTPLLSGDLLELVRQGGRHGEAEVSAGA
jgi:hypothetical protein